jgi:hypothetical protein
MKAIIGGKLYDTDKAILVAHDRYWDGSNFDRHGRNHYLYKTKNGRFFLYRVSCWQGERSYIEPLTEDEAKEWYEELDVHEVDYEEAFGVQPEEA